MPSAVTPPGRKRLGQVGVVVTAVVFLLLALRLLQHELQPEVWAGLPGALEALPPWRVGAAVVGAVVVYCWLGWFDRLGFFVVQRPMSTAFAVRTSFMAYALAHNLGLGLLTGPAVRARRYRSRGISAETVARIYGSNVVTMWLGYALVLGVTLIWRPPNGLPIEPVWSRVAGVALVALPLAYLVVAWAGLRPVRVRRLSVAVPGLGWAGAQVLSGALHWTLSALVLWLLLPRYLCFVDVLGALCIAQVVVAFSHVPAGVGVLEGTLLLLIGEDVDRTGFIAGVLLFRAVYYLLPLALTALNLMGGRVVVGCTPAALRR